MVLRSHVALPLVAGCQRKLFAGRLLRSCRCTAKQRKCLRTNRWKKREFPLEKKKSEIWNHLFLYKHKWLPRFEACTTWSFGLPVCDATQSEDDGALVLLNDLRVEHSTSSARIQMCSKGNCGFLLFYRTVAHFLSSLTFTQNQIVMGKRRAVKRPDMMTMNQPMHPSDPVRSAGDRKRQRCVSECLWHINGEGKLTTDVNITLDVYCCKSAQGIIMIVNQFERTSDPFGGGGDVFWAPM